MRSKGQDERVGWGEVLTPDYRLPLALACMGVWLHAADSLVVATMMPAIVADIGGAELMSWTVSLYDIGSIVMGAASGLLATRHGIRLPMIGAACLFAVGCAVSACAPQMWILLTGRLMQGLGGGGLMALSFVSVGLLFPQRLIARAMAAVSTLWGISAFLGPLVGGLFAEYGSWRGGFWFFAAQAVGLALWIATRQPAGRAPSPATDSTETFPIVRLLWLSAGVVAIAYAGIDISYVRTPFFLALGLACLIAFLRFDAASGDNRLLPENPFGFQGPVSAALTMIICFAAATVAIGVYVPFLITHLHGLSALSAGYIIAIEAIAWTIAAALISGSPERNDPMMIVIGMLIVATSIAGLGYSVAYGPIWLLVLCSAAQGGGFGMAWTFIVRRATSLAPAGETQRVSGAIPTVQRTGYALGAAYLGIIANAAGIADTNPSFTAVAIAVFAACLPLAAIGLLAALRFASAKTP